MIKELAMALWSLYYPHTECIREDTPPSKEMLVWGNRWGETEETIQRIPENIDSETSDDVAYEYIELNKEYARLYDLLQEYIWYDLSHGWDKKERRDNYLKTDNFRNIVEPIARETNFLWKEIEKMETSEEFDATATYYPKLLEKCYSYGFGGCTKKQRYETDFFSLYIGPFEKRYQDVLAEKMNKTRTKGIELAKRRINMERTAVAKR